MRTLFILGLAIGGAFLAGWFTIERDGDRTRIEINKSEIRNDTRHAIDKGRDILDQREQERLARSQGEESSQPGNQDPYGNRDPYATQNSYPTQNPYPPQNQYPGQPTYNPSGFPPPYAGQSPYPTQAPYGEQATNPRWTETPPPWQQQTR